MLAILFCLGITIVDQDSIQKLLMICHQLQQDGQQPSVALLRGKAPMKISVTTAIEAIRRFNAGGSKQSDDSKVKISKDANRIAALEKQVERLESAVAALEERLDNIASS
ncbi:hypothetical protein CA267_013840 [Alteromonas pelagimontana]|uniref:Uncharacterized protein n=1 Tax=Alteromonas pelagimontana TaxID=1858656 RepID=A0A6M4MFA2_9ALTE|nr:hypothetical protein [Alteromonas pelagimontana]QJR81763.1 hypothetical protein CA267_013840 [Alteromonas pelagimontana]